VTSFFAKERTQDHLGIGFRDLLATGLALAAVGPVQGRVLYGRTTDGSNEPGYRMALDTQSGDLLQIVFSSASVSAANGIFTGLGLA
jgi:hypothetical protein